MPKAKSTALETITKRDGSVVPFDTRKITIAVEKAMRATGEYKDGEPPKVADAVVRALEVSYLGDPSFEVTVERV